MTALSHLDPNFSTVAAIQAINEPIKDATRTPGLGECTSPYSFFTQDLSRFVNE